MRPIARHLLKRFELYLAISATVFVGVVYLLFRYDLNTGFTVAVTVLGMGFIQGAIQWADLERSKHLRTRQIHEIREMLRDQVLNQLASMKLWLAEAPDPQHVELLVSEVGQSIDEIAELIDQLSEQQLDTWKLTYANAAKHIEMPESALAAMPTVPRPVPGAAVARVEAVPQAAHEAVIVRAETPAPAAKPPPPDAVAPRVALWK